MSEHAQIAPDVVIDGRVRLRHPIGRGGMGEVWVAEHVRLRTLVAVKLMSSSLCADDEAFARFCREARAAASIDSPHVVKIHDFGEHAGRPYIVMEHLNGESLAARLKREPRPSFEQVVWIVKQVASGLTAALAAGVVHRDLKPANIFLASVGGREVLKVLDFGAAKLLGATALTVDGSAIGSPAYMSPEQVSASRKLDHRSDQFSLAVLAYRLLTGKMPFKGENAIDTMIAITQGEFVPATRHAPELPLAIDAWFSRALARAPEQRHASPRELADSLEQALLPSARSVPPRPAHPSFAPPSSMAPTLPRAAPRSSSSALVLVIVMGALAAVTGALVIAAALGWFFFHEQRSREAELPSVTQGAEPAATPSAAPRDD